MGNVTNSKEIEKLLKQNGWALDRISGSHATYFKEGFGVVIIPKHNRDIDL